MKRICPAGRRTSIALALLSLACASGGVGAQQVEQRAEPKAADAAPTLHEVRIEADANDKDFGANQLSLGRLPSDLRDVPQSVTVINQPLMQSQGATSLASALRNVPGLTIGGAEGGQIGNNINLNGFSARTDVFLDGARDRGQYYRDTFALDPIEVLMGPSSMLFGRGSTGGVINQVTKKPSLKAADEVQLSVNSTGLVRTVLDHNQPLSDTSAFRVAVMAQEGDATNRDQTKLQDFGIAPSLKLGIGTPTQITLSALLQHNRDMPDYGVPNLNGAPAAVDRKTAYGFTDDRTISDVVALEALVEHRLNTDWSLRNQTQFNRVTTDARETAPQVIGTLGANGAFSPLSTGTTASPVAASSSLPLSQLWVRQQSHDRVIHDESTFNLTEVDGHFTTGGVKHALLAGVELGHDTYGNQAYYRNGSCNGIALNPAGGTSGYAQCTPLLDPPQVASPATAPSVSGNDATGRADTVAVFANDTLELLPGFKVVAGLRHDRYDAHIGNSIPTATALASVDQTVNFTSVRAGAIWQPAPAQTYYVSYSTSFNPSLEQLVATTGGTQPLPPEENRSYEGGGKWDLNGGNLSLSAAAFETVKHNARSQDATGVYTATGTIRVEGVRAGVAGHVTDHLQLFGGYTHLDAVIVDGIAPATTGKVPGNTPKDSASLWSTYALSREWEIGGGATYSAKRFVNNTDLVQVGAYTRWDTTLAYHQHDYDIRLNVFNVFNKYYYDALIQSDGGRSVPGLGRSAAITLAHRF